MLRKLFFVLALLVLSGPASAGRIPHGLNIIATPGPTGTSQIGIDQNEITPQFMTNALKGMSFVRQGTAGVNPAIIDVNQYASGGTINGTTSVYGEENFNLWANQQYLFTFPATRITGGIQFVGITFNVPAMSHAT